MYPDSCCATFRGTLGHVLPKPPCLFLAQYNSPGGTSVNNHGLGLSFKEKPSQFRLFSLLNCCPFPMYLQCKEVCLFTVWLLTSLLSLALLLLEIGPWFRRAVASVCWKLLAMGCSNTPFVGLAQHIVNAVGRVCFPWQEKDRASGRCFSDCPQTSISSAWAPSRLPRRSLQQPSCITFCPSKLHWPAMDGIGLISSLGEALDL